jgi:hypothetical protein
MLEVVRYRAGVVRRWPSTDVRRRRRRGATMMARRAIKRGRRVRAVNAMMAVEEYQVMHLHCRLIGLYLHVLALATYLFTYNCPYVVIWFQVF